MGIHRCVVAVCIPFLTLITVRSDIQCFKITDKFLVIRNAATRFDIFSNALKKNI